MRRPRFDALGRRLRDARLDALRDRSTKIREQLASMIRHRLEVVRGRLSRLRPAASVAAASYGEDAHVRPTPRAPGVIREEYVRRTIFPGRQAHGGPPRPPDHPSFPSRSMLHVTRTVERRLRRLKETRDFVEAEDPVEAVHELRVSSRRLRAFVDTFGPFLDPSLVRRAKAPLKQVTRSVGTLREADVHAGCIADEIATASSDAHRAALEHVLERVDAKRRRERKRALRLLRKADLDSIAPLLRKALDQLAEREASPSITFDVIAWLALEPMLERVASARPPDDGTERAEAMHELRIALKKLRYAVELLEPALGGHYEEIHSRLKRMQSLLGDHHDRVVLVGLLEKRRARLDDDGVLSRGLDTAIVAAQNEQSRLFQRFERERGSLDPEWLSDETRTALSGHSDLGR